MKVCGSVGVVCALVCVLVTVTTTVIHMSRLQGLRKCVYTAKARYVQLLWQLTAYFYTELARSIIPIADNYRIRSCTCYGAPEGDPGVLFEGTPHCEAVHGALHACLRALFGVSVAGILACIFSCMLVYQLLSHEKKKMYWEQLELRCRSLYGQGGTVGPATGSCGCCNDCGGASPWWAQTPGNLYTPNPDLAPSRFVSPNRPLRIRFQSADSKNAVARMSARSFRLPRDARREEEIQREAWLPARTPRKQKTLPFAFERVRRNGCARDRLCVEA